MGSCNRVKAPLDIFSAFVTSRIESMGVGRQKGVGWEVGAGGKL